MDDSAYVTMPGESDLVESFEFGQGRIQIPSLACVFDLLSGINDLWR